MKYADFMVLVQLGVGLHAGAALLQLYGDLGTQPLVRIFSRIRALLEECKEEREKIESRLHEIEAEFEFFKIRFFNEFKKYLIVNTSVAILLVVLLIFMSYSANAPLTGIVSVFIIAASFLPALVTLSAVLINARNQIKPIIEAARALQDEAMAS